MLHCRNKKIDKDMALLLRSTYSLLRTLPAYDVYHACRKSSYSKATITFDFHHNESDFDGM